MRKPKLKAGGGEQKPDKAFTISPAHTIKLNDVQKNQFIAMVTERARVDRDMQIAASMILASSGVDFERGGEYKFDGENLIYNPPVKAPE